ncbi:hypothetical protein [Bartonella massiliensis]|nr:hypothetical protein [Bartonella massiliensis]
MKREAGKKGKLGSVEGVFYQKVRSEEGEVDVAGKLSVISMQGK